MKQPRPSHLTKLELRVMQVVWRLGPSSVSAVQSAIEPSLAYTTVQTMLNILERKGQVRREREGRAFIYSAIVSEDSATGSALRDLIDRVFGGSPEELVMSLLRSRDLDAAKLAELSRRLESTNARTEEDE